MQSLRSFVYRNGPLKLLYAAYSHVRRGRARGSDAGTLVAVDAGGGRRFYVYDGDEKGQRYLRRFDVGTGLHRAWRRTAESYDVFVDAGSNYGEYVMVLVEAGAVERAKVFAFEPNARVAGAQRRTLEEAGVADRVDLRVAGLSDRAGELTFFVNRADSGASSTNALFAINPARGIFLDKQRIPVEVGDQAVGPAVGADSRIALKIDVEGHDFHVLAGFRETLTRAAAYYVALESDRKTFETGLTILGEAGLSGLFDGAVFAFYGDRFHRCEGIAELRGHYDRVANNLDIVVTNDDTMRVFLDGLAADGQTPQPR